MMQTNTKREYAAKRRGILNSLQTSCHIRNVCACWLRSVYL